MDTAEIINLLNSFNGRDITREEYLEIKTAIDAIKDEQTVDAVCQAVQPDQNRGYGVKRVLYMRWDELERERKEKYHQELAEQMKDGRYSSLVSAIRVGCYGGDLDEVPF